MFKELRLDRNQHLNMIPTLPRSLRTLHLEGCTSLSGTKGTNPYSLIHLYTSTTSSGQPGARSQEPGARSQEPGARHQDRHSA